MVECTVVNNQVTDVRVPKEDVNASTHCPKIRHVKTYVNDYCNGPNRLRHPLKRVNGELKKTTWDDALNIHNHQTFRNQKGIWSGISGNLALYRRFYDDV